ncbi:hypothetical protein MTR67_053290 [Solanum verrucosum]|uniref:Uncharacterized protein n=1 Tax=Solanum verrucosum TaxID=315347 RepID=A0AAF0V7C5_SOLVR|nr:hypothetical protein MTR67_053290 [Solanum verrucosum]
MLPLWRVPRGPKYVVLKLWGIDSWIQDSGVEMEDCVWLSICTTAERIDSELCADFCASYVL